MDPGQIGVSARPYTEEGAGDGEQAGVAELHQAMGEIDGDGGAGGVRGRDDIEEPDPGGEPERAADRGICAEGGGLRAAVGDPAEGHGRGERAVWGVAGGGA